MEKFMCRSTNTWQKYIINIFPQPHVETQEQQGRSKVQPQVFIPRQMISETILETFHF